METVSWPEMEGRQGGRRDRTESVSENDTKSGRGWREAPQKGGVGHERGEGVARQERK